MTAPIRIGDDLHLGEADYWYGAGELYLRVTQIGSVERYHDGQWLKVAGLPLRADGSLLTTKARSVLVRLPEA
jgi:hypothetical protein